MRWIRYTASGKTAYGILDGETISEVSGDPFEGYEKTPVRHALADVKIELPVIPRTFYAVGFNYPEHVREIAAKQGVEPNLPTQPDVGYRANNSLIAHDETIIVPKLATEKVQYEGELVVVIGRQAKHLSEADALSCVLGYTIGNDMSERTWQASDRTLWRAKNTDTFAPMGPWIETDVELDKLETIVRRNGREDIRFKTNAMLFGVERYISTISQVCTLYPGDVIWMGTDGASPNLVDGDVIEVEITGIGMLRNPLKREA
ncbi:MAG: fumarylacetoacetate hydrolase family protein [Alphaproteobacteria bacterium]|nr:fumarylacetoacetate hydrolase family protein [Alphaproteobacteria bacterium]